MFKKILLAMTAMLATLILGIILVIQFGPVTSSAVLFNAVFGTGVATPSQQTLHNRLTVPPGFSVGIYADNLPRIRFLQFTTAGDLVVSQPRKGDVLLIKRDRNGDGQADGSSILLSGLKRPHGIALYQQWLYIAESNAVGRVEFDAERGVLRGDYQHIIGDLTDNGNHWTKSIGFGPDGKLYLSMGSTCNVCEEDDPRRAAIMRFNADGSDGEIYATGLRNSVGFDWAPWDNSLYATDNGRDLLGDDYPPCELNRIVKGGFYGWPYVNGFGDPDPDFGKRGKAQQAQAINPAHGFRAHNAPLGIVFLKTNSWPTQYHNTALVALHGSWNRSEPDGYKVVSLHYQGNSQGNSQSNDSFIEKDFLVGFEKAGDVIGRPVDIAQGPDECVYISDDYAGVIYRVCYQSNAQQAMTDNTSTVTSSTVTSSTVKSMTDGGAVSPRQRAMLRSNGLEQWDKAEQQRLAQRGEEIFLQQSCNECHTFSADSASDKTATVEKKLLNGIAQRYSLNDLLAFFATPTPPMPTLNLPQDQQQALAVFLLREH